MNCDIITDIANWWDDNGQNVVTAEMEELIDNYDFPAEELEEYSWELAQRIFKGICNLIKTHGLRG